MAEKKIFVKTYGCQMNEYDSDRMKDIMESQNYSQASSAEDADMVILNTCHIREKASEKVYSELGRIKKSHEKQGKKAIIAIAGCVAQAQGKNIIKRMPGVDMVFGPQSYHKLPEYISEVKKGKKVIETDFHEEDKFNINRSKNPEKVTAFLSVQEGCDKFCSFCVVPYTRGAEFSRPVESILSEAKELVQSGIKEITLLGQNVNAYHGFSKNGKIFNLGDLLFLLSEINGLERLRYTTSHPHDMHQRLFEAHRDIDKIMPYLHLPVQSGSSKILKAMNRKHTVESYIDIIEKMRKMRPGLALSGDFIVGFPGETEEDFEQTMSLVKKIKYASAFSFKYSPRPGTTAEKLENNVDNDVSSHRLLKLQKLLSDQQKEFNESFNGKQITILAEKKGRHEGQIIGRSPYLQAVYCEANVNFGDFIKVQINKTGQNALQGEVVYAGVKS